ncbi:ubiquinol oxidase subunit II [Paenibacillus kribbensis]|uniref:Quinol oxidase subunit 2 n=1 Tax=Paenibacillus kribbensis TaxID=172713 RepID=A0A222WHM4_9BACL|nr:ubiquinol oxidase subunit II [Paenibacillus kribbensis]ASR45910.1 ubiquinol oxidase subunit II [Paenibacillus kribbensis]
MNKKPKAIIALVLTVLTVALLIWTCFYAGGKYVVFDPKGPVGQAQKELIIITTALSALIIVPVMILTFFIIWRYRDSATNKVKYQPHWDDSKKLETVWWAIPIIVICIIAVITARYTYLLEPSKPIASTQKPVTIQVASLDWKWLFMYPEEGIATVNQVHIPKGVPVRFELTADAPMNSFWIPQLGGQIYTMSGMAMKLHLQADHEGTYFGSGANFSGEHFGQMRFDVEVQSDEAYKNWVADIKKQSKPLTKDGYLALAKPGLSQPDEYSSIPDGLFQNIVTKYVVDGASNPHAGHGASTEDSSKSGTEDKGAMDMSHMNMSGHN